MKVLFLILLLFLTGCTKTITKTVYVHPEPFKFIPIEINVTEVKEVEPFPLKGLIKFVDDRNESVKMSVDTWLKLRRAKRDEHRANIKLKRHNKMYKKANRGLNRQIELYNSVE